MNLFAERITAGNYATFWVCECCMLTHANGECCGGSVHEAEPLSKIPGTADVSLGLLAEHHADTCTSENRESGECDCEHNTFSWSSCDGCGSLLGGTRDALTVVYDMHTEA